MKHLLMTAAFTLTSLAASGVVAGPSLIIHQVLVDYAKWRPAYDAHKGARDAAGLTNCQVQSSVDNPNDVYVTCDMADVAKAKAFSMSPDLARVMKGAGVIGKPGFFLLAAPR